MAVHDRPARPVRRLLAGGLRPRARRHRLTRRRGGPPRHGARSELDDPHRLARRRDPRRAARAHRGPRRRPVARPGHRDRSPTPRPSAGPVIARPYREGVLGRPSSVSPFTARTQADRDLVALVFSGLVRNGPDGTLVPDLAERWSVDATGATWTFQLRDDARWHDGEPVTAEDVAFTIRVLQDPAYTGPAAGPGTRSRVQADRHADGRLHAGDAARRLPPGRDPADRAGAPPRRRPGRPSCADDPFGRAADRVGPFAARQPRRRRGRARPGGADPTRPSRRPTEPVAAADRLAGHARADRAGRPAPCRTSPASSSASSTTRGARGRRTGPASSTPPPGSQPAMTPATSRRDAGSRSCATRARR